MDGKSAFSPEVRRRRQVRILERNSFEPLRFPGAEWTRRTDAQLQRKLRIFGDGADGPLRLFRIGPAQRLLFRPLSAFTVTNGSGASFVAPDEYRNVDLRSPTIPVHVTGRLRGIPTGRNLAIAVNGKIQATTVSFRTAVSSDVIFAAMVPEGSFHQGRNRVEVLEIQPGGALRRLGRV
jgi:hypothetical protein